MCRINQFITILLKFFAKNTKHYLLKIQYASLFRVLFVCGGNLYFFNIKWHVIFSGYDINVIALTRIIS